MPVNVEAWLSDPVVGALSPTAENGLFHLLLHAWQAPDGPDSLACSLPDDDAELARLSRLHTYWSRVGPVLRRLLVVVPAPSGVRRLRYLPQFADYCAIVESKARRAQGAAARWGTAAPDVVGPDPAAAEAHAWARHADATPLVGADEETAPAYPPYTAPTGADAERLAGTVERYSGVLAATANRALGEHRDAKRRQITARIVSSDPRSEDAARTLLAAGVPLQFAATTVAALAQSHNARGAIYTLGYFTRSVLDAWQVECDDAAARDAGLAAMVPPADAPSPTSPKSPKSPKSPNVSSPTERGARTGHAAAVAYDFLFPSSNDSNDSSASDDAAL